MMILKGCPKCHGDLVAETSPRRLQADDDIVCIQCGYYLRPNETRALVSRVMRELRARPEPALSGARR
jgi:hypothetical protein